MRPVLFAPHNDDETLFTSFLIQKLRNQGNPPLVITVFKSVVQETMGITAQEREWETASALVALGYAVDEDACEQWPFPDDGTVHVEEIKDAMRELVVQEYAGELPPVLVPAWSDAGHSDHNTVNVAALELFKDVVEYLTYDYGGDKQRRGVEVVPEREWVLRKMKALACYESQILRGPHRFWLMDLHEYTRSRIVA